MNRSHTRRAAHDDAARVERPPSSDPALSPVGRAFLVMTAISFLGFALAAVG